MSIGSIFVQGYGIIDICYCLLCFLRIFSYKILHDKPIISCVFFIFSVSPFFSFLLYLSVCSLVFPEIASQGARFVVLQYNKR